jgi:cobalt-zinc-cadmium efflux system membrane fusion protein
LVKSSRHLQSDSNDWICIMNWNLKSRSRGLAPLAALVVLTATVGCDKKSAEKADSPIVAPKVEKGRVVFPSASPHLSALQIESARAGTNFSLIFPGKLAWDENVTVRVFSPFGGRIIRVLAEPGRVVEKGKPLAILASADFGQAQADARRARTDIALAERNLTRLRTLLENGAAAQKDLASAEADLERAKAEEERARGRLQLFGVDSFTVDNNFTLKAPLDGILVDKSINPGQEVRADRCLRVWKSWRLRCLPLPTRPGSGCFWT